MEVREYSDGRSSLSFTGLLIGLNLKDLLRHLLEFIHKDQWRVLDVSNGLTRYIVSSVAQTVGRLLKY